MDKDKIFVIGFGESLETSYGYLPEFCAQLPIALVQNLTKFAKFEIKNDDLQVKIWVKMALTCQKNGKVAKFEIKNGK